MPVYIGIDWSENKHDIVMMNKRRAVLSQFVIEHSAEGFMQLAKAVADLQQPPDECEFALETAHNLLIDFLWSQGFNQVYVVPPNVVKSSRGRYRQSGANDDKYDAQVLADLLRTDIHRLQPWQPDSLLTRQMRAEVSLHHHLTAQTTRIANRLRAVLIRYYPAALEVFSDLKAQITLHFIQTYPTPQTAKSLTIDDFKAFAKQHRYSRPQKLPACFARLQAPQPQALPETVLVYEQEAVLLARLLLETVQSQKATLRSLKAHFQQHPDAHIFASLPGAGDFLAPALLVKFGDHRDRFASAAAVQALAGTCPVTQQSGKRRTIKFRRSCDKHFRHIAQQWAIASLDQSVWANTYWQQVKPRCHSKNHAYRCLANRWLAIAWKLWQTRQPYDEAYHLRQRERFAS